MLWQATGKGQQATGFKVSWCQDFTISLCFNLTGNCYSWKNPQSTEVIGFWIEIRKIQR
ncbi:hypothetical protein H6H03_29350 [Nostoc paludosum FACHB-159]|uniref:Uncharacterized protein n=1 Tax=Nostoc paludosum FACHB-159 TaxID=2692908 RepID=A0ABR8KEF1_9NOSO|nr:hypothetical protein [Nostoc paludosum FACHB-159]